MAAINIPPKVLKTILGKTLVVEIEKEISRTLRGKIKDLKVDSVESEGFRVKAYFETEPLQESVDGTTFRPYMVNGIAVEHFELPLVDVRDLFSLLNNKKRVFGEIEHIVSIED